MARTHWIYLVCFTSPLGHAQHYIGSTDDVAARLTRHASGQGSRLVRAVTRAGIPFTCTRLWRVESGDGRLVERRLKTLGSRKRICPRCTPGTGWGRFPGTVDVPVPADLEDLAHA